MTDWPDDIAAQFPEPRPEEPESLRQDIVDELSDHLQCALHRERHFTQDEAEACQRVLDRFGNPARIARQLWFDWMKEKIMSQRITLIMSCVMAAACLAAVGLAWTAVQETRDLNASVLAQLKTLVAERSKAPSAPEPSKEPSPLEWTPVKVKLVKGSDDGPPVEGFKVVLRGNIYGQKGYGGYGGMAGDKVSRISGPDGIADLGLVGFGQQRVEVTSFWGEIHSETFWTRPGKPNIVEIVCPASPPEDSEISPSIDWPKELQDAELGGMLVFDYTGREVQGNRWTLEGTQRYRVDVLPDERLVDFGQVSDSEDDAPQPAVQVTWPAGSYQLREMAVLGPDEAREGRSDSNVLAQYFPYGKRRSIQGGEYGGGAGMMAQGGGYGRDVPDLDQRSLIDRLKYSFQSRTDQANRWTITLPDELIEQVRQALRQGKPM